MAIRFIKTENLKNKQLKQQLVDCLKQEKVSFIEVAEAFYQKSYRNKESYLALADAIIHTVDKVLSQGNWEESLFLRNALKPLKEVREQSIALKKEASAVSADQPVKLRALKNDEVRVYISLFQNDGHDLRKWALQLSALRSHLLGRPIYEKKDDVLKVIRRKLVQVSEAYIVLVIKRSDIQDFSYQEGRVDRFGNPLLTIKDDAVKAENILEFVHQGQHYAFLEGRLFPLS